MAAKKRPALYWRRESPHSQSTGLATSGESVARQKQRTREEAAGVKKKATEPPASTGPIRPVTLKELCQEDKVRVRKLVEQLAIAGDEKERLEKQILEDRNHFSGLLVKLKEHHKKVVEEKQQILTELQSSQLQLQDLHKYPPLSAPIPPNPLVHQPITSPSSSSSAYTLTTPTSHVTPMETVFTSQASHVTTGGADSILQTRHMTSMSPAAVSQASHVTPWGTASILQTSHVTTMGTVSSLQTNHVTPMSTVSSLQTSHVTPGGIAQRLTGLPCSGGSGENEQASNTPTEDGQSLLLATPTGEAKIYRDFNGRSYPASLVAQGMLFSGNPPASLHPPPITSTALHARDVIGCTALPTRDVPTQTTPLESISTQTEPDSEPFMPSPLESLTSSLSPSASEPQDPPHSSRIKTSPHSGRPWKQFPSSKINECKEVTGQTDRFRVQNTQSGNVLLPSKINPPLSSPRQHAAKMDAKHGVEKNAHINSPAEAARVSAGVQNGSLGESRPRSIHVHTRATAHSDHNVSQGDSSCLSRQNGVSHSSGSMAHSGSYLPDQVGILLSTALLNAEHTLQAVRALTTSVSGDHSLLTSTDVPSVGVASVNGGPSLLHTTDVPSVGIVSHQSRLDSTEVPSVGVASVSGDQSPLNTIDVPSVGVAKDSPSLITHSINRTNSKMILSTRLSRPPKPRSRLGTPVSMETDQHSCTWLSLSNANQSDSSLSVTDLVSVLNPRQTEAVSTRHSDTPKSSCLASTRGRSKVKSHPPVSSESSCGGSEMRYRTSSTPRFQGREELLKVLSCPLGSTIGDQSGLFYVSDIFEHAHSQSQRLHEVDKSRGNYSEHAQSQIQETQSIYNSETEDELGLGQLNSFLSDSSNSSLTMDSRDGFDDQDIIQQLFFIR